MHRTGKTNGLTDVSGLLVGHHTDTAAACVDTVTALMPIEPVEAPDSEMASVWPACGPA